MDTSTTPTAVAVSRIALTVNGQPRQLELDPGTSLLDARREHLHLTKKGCDHGQCAACTVLINGRRINSCLTLAVMHDDDDGFDDKANVLGVKGRGELGLCGAGAAVGNAVFNATG